MAGTQCLLSRQGGRRRTHTPVGAAVSATRSRGDRRRPSSPVRPPRGRRGGGGSGAPDPLRLARSRAAGARRLPGGRRPPVASVGSDRSAPRCVARAVPGQPGAGPHRLCHSAPCAVCDHHAGRGDDGRGADLPAQRPNASRAAGRVTAGSTAHRVLASGRRRCRHRGAAFRRLPGGAERGRPRPMAGDRTAG